MDSSQITPLLLIGLVAGVLVGMFGGGGGVILVPAMVLLASFNLKTATETSMAAWLPPFAVLGVLEYSRQGQISIVAALIVAIGMFIGTFGGAKLSLSLPIAVINCIFAAFLSILALRYFFLGISFLSTEIR